MADETVAQALARHIAAAEPMRLPPAVRAVAENLALDVVGLCIAARNTDYVRAVAASGLSLGCTTAIGHISTFDCAGSALINGTAAHGEDFDDTFEGGPVHAGAVVVPAVLAAAEQFGGRGAALRGRDSGGGREKCRLWPGAPPRRPNGGVRPT